MGLLKSLLYGSSPLLLGSCGLFTEIPSKVIEGQRVAHQGLVLIEDNITSILDAYEQDCKAAVTYHVMFIYEEKLENVRGDASLDQHELAMEVDRLTSRRDEEIKSAFVKIEQRRREMLSVVTKNAVATKKLIEAVYSYMSATPITIDNADFWIVKIVEASRGRD
jgi:hypothetical protein